VVNLEKNFLPRGSLGSSLCSFPLQFSFRVAASSLRSWMWFLSFYEGAIAETRCRSSIRLFGAFPMQVATTAPQTSRALLAVFPDMAKILETRQQLLVLLITSHHGRRRKHRSHYCCILLLLWRPASLLSRYVITAVV
jgi:hypothetical protein